MTGATLTRGPIDPTPLLEAVASDSHGASVLFLGTVRDVNEGRAVSGLEYEAYEAMASGELAAIVDEAEARFAGCRIAVIHRLGVLGLGETSVAIAASHAHRAPAFEACRHVLEELKRRVPIWKREQYVDGTRHWVGEGAPLEEQGCR